MGTRNLTMVVHNGQTKIAQYGQWDGYPSGQGITILTFLNKIKYPTNYKKFIAKLNRTHFIDDEKQKEIDAFLKSIGCESGWMNMEQADLYHKEYPLLTRNNGAKILWLMYGQKGRKPMWLHDSSDFAADGLFNEWTYVVDLDKRTFEVYEGFKKTFPNKEDRFYQITVDIETAEKKALDTWDNKVTELTHKGVPMEAITKQIGNRPYVSNDKYYLQHVHTFNIDELPTEKEFLEICEPKDE